MSDNTTGQVLGASTAIVLPATIGAVSGVNFFYALSIFAGALVIINIAALIIKKAVQSE